MSNAKVKEGFSQCSILLTLFKPGCLIRSSPEADPGMTLSPWPQRPILSLSMIIPVADFAPRSCFFLSVLHVALRKQMSNLAE